MWPQIFDTPLDPSWIEVVGDVSPERSRYKVVIAPSKPNQIVFFRLASSTSTSLKLVKALAEIGSLVLGDLVPKQGKTGSVRSYAGQEWEYLITEFIDDSMTMEAVWEDIRPDNRIQLIQEIQQAIICLRSISRDDERVKNILPDIKTNIIGGGTRFEQHFFPDLWTMLCGIVTIRFPSIQPKQVSVMTEGDSGDVIVEATNMSAPAVRLSYQDLASLTESHIHFTHMDMEPRNILLRKDHTADSHNQYKLAVIIDWEMAGFYPDGLEDMHKTIGFGSCSIVWDWYDAYMNFCAIQSPRDPCVARLMEAIYLILTSTEQQFKGISKRLQDAYRAKLELKYDSKQMRMVRREGALSTTEYSTKSFEDWVSKCLQTLRK